MSPDLKMPVSITTNTPDVDFGAGLDSVAKQKLSSDSGAFNNEYRRQVDAQESRRAQQQSDARQADMRADQARRAKDDRLADQRADRREQDRRSGNDLPDKGREAERDVRVAARKTADHDRNTPASKANDTRNQGPDKHTRNKTVEESSDTGPMKAEQATTVESADGNQKQEVEEVTDTATQTSETQPGVSVEQATLVEGVAEAGDDLSPYFLQQLSGANASQREDGSASGLTELENITPKAGLEQWMGQTLSGDPSTADGVEGDDDLNAKASILSESVKGALGKGVVGEGATISSNSETVAVSSKVSELNGPVQEQVKGAPEETGLLGERVTDKLPKEPSVSQVNPLAQAVNTANLRRDIHSQQSRVGGEPSATLSPSSNDGSSGFSLSEVKQLMQERKALLEGGNQSIKNSNEESMVSQVDKLLAADKKLAGGMDVLRQLRIPGAEAKSSTLDDSSSGVKPLPFARALDQMSTVKTEEVKPFSTTISTPMNKPGFVPEFNQRIMMMIGQKIQSAQIMLTPEELGQIDVTVKFNQDQQASIVFASQQPATREALESGAQRLRDMLEENGVDLESVDIQEQLANGRHQGEDGKSENLAGLENTDATKVTEEEEGDESDAVVTLATDRIVDFYA